MNPEEIRTLYRRGKITLGQARNLLGAWLVGEEELEKLAKFLDVIERGE